MKADLNKLIIKMLVMILSALIVLPAIFFISAGTLQYWEAWVLCGVVLLPMLFVLAYFLKHDPEFLMRRSQYRETRPQQARIISISSLLFFAGMLIPGLDHRFQWSQVPAALVLLSDILFFLGYMFIFYVFRENRYASRIVEVTKGQKVISTGPYAFVRHPMYLGSLVMYLAMPVAVGSYWAVLPFLTMPIVLVLRILDEEKLLSKELPGYARYMKKTRYRLVPFIW